VVTIQKICQSPVKCANEALIGKGVFAVITRKGSQNKIILDSGWALNPMAEGRKFGREERAL
jgi:hypothetical protein